MSNMRIRTDGQKLILHNWLDPGPDADAAVEGREKRWATAAPVVDAISRELGRIRGTHELSDAGRAAGFVKFEAETNETVGKLLNVIEPGMRKDHETLEGAEANAVAGRVWDRAAGGYVRDPNARALLERNAETLALERELRDRWAAQGVSQPEMEREYVRAVAEDTDRDRLIADAIESSPIPLVGEATLETGREIRISRSPQAARIRAMRAAYAADLHLLEMFCSEVYELFPMLAVLRGRAPLPRLKPAPRMPVVVEGRKVVSFTKSA